MNTAPMFSSASDEWATPADFMAKMRKRFGHFDLDVCASESNAQCAIFFDRAKDGLSQQWCAHYFPGSPALCWMNPPYGRTIGVWMRKALKESQMGATVVCLVPSRTDTRWWHDYAMRAAEIDFVKGRLAFIGKGDAPIRPYPARSERGQSAPFPSAVVVFRPGYNLHVPTIGVIE